MRLQYGVEGLFHVLDMGNEGATITSTEEASGINHTRISTFFSILDAGGYAAVARSHRGRYECVAMPPLKPVCNGYNDLLCEVVAEEMPQRPEPARLRQLAVARLAVGQGLQVQNYEEAHVLDVAAKEGMGSPAGILFRALSSVALMARRQHVVEREVRQRVQDWGARRK